ncbi:hypothetical protein, partial [Sphingobacterium sp. UBA6317]|uniref:hypothetical protein n=1 Tax=Sphingobacterium sp. UBA6317 TaxID=1947509 RepID=UPI00257D9CA8
LSTSVFPCTGYCISSAYRFSQHRTVGVPGPSVAVPQTVAVLQPQLLLCSVVMVHYSYLT